jgi:hypothetical protein
MAQLRDNELLTRQLSDLQTEVKLLTLDRARQVRESGRLEAGLPPQASSAAALPAKDLIELAYQAILGRPAEPDSLAWCVAQLESGTPFAHLFVEIATSEEARLRAEGLSGRSPMGPVPAVELV